MSIQGRHDKDRASTGIFESGGDEEDRTPDLRIANATLSQLSYVPTAAISGEGGILARVPGQGKCWDGAGLQGRRQPAHFGARPRGPRLGPQGKIPDRKPMTARSQEP